MNLPHQVLEQLRELVGKVTGNPIPPGVPFNPVAAVRILEQVMAQQQALIGVLVNERSNYRYALGCIAFHAGLNNGVFNMDEFIILDWPPDPEAPKEKRVIAPPKGLVSVH